MNKGHKLLSGKKNILLTHIDVVVNDRLGINVGRNSKGMSDNRVSDDFTYVERRKKCRNRQNVGDSRIQNEIYLLYLLYLPL